MIAAAPSRVPVPPDVLHQFPDGREPLSTVRTWETPHLPIVNLLGDVVDHPLHGGAPPDHEDVLADWTPHLRGLVVAPRVRHQHVKQNADDVERAAD